MSEARFFTQNPKLDRLLLGSLCAYLALLAVITLDTFFTTLDTNFWAPWLLQVVPLLLLVPGMLQKHYRSYSWLCFLMLAYFTSYTVQVFSDPYGVYNWLGLLLTIGLFVVGMYCSRLLQRRLKGID